MGKTLVRFWAWEDAYRGRGNGDSEGCVGLQAPDGRWGEYLHQGGVGGSMELVIGLFRGNEDEELQEK